ncbi:hypothetical protein [Flavobacterium sp.]|uniref:hypothetical protein n=1 Tax=Flavobacterium sp. TaxID=239 RepID=UPI003340B3ED
MRKIFRGDEIIVKEKNFQYFTFGKIYRVDHTDSKYFTLTNNIKESVSFMHTEFDMYFEILKLESKDEAPKHYDNSNGSLYLFADKQGLNTWEFDIVKRIVRCRKKGNFKEDLEKTKFLIDLYLKEWTEN